jgi:phage regulator Rha-like protein
MLTGWTGKEIQFAAEYIKQWDEIEANRQQKN